MRFEDTPFFRATATEISTLTQVVEDAKLFLLDMGGDDFRVEDKRLQESIANATQVLRSIVNRLQEERL